MKRRLSERICACKARSGASLRELPPYSVPVSPRAGTGTLRQSLAFPDCTEPEVAPAVPRGRPCHPRAGEQDCESVNILFILSITLLHYSLFNPLLFYY